MACVLDSIIYHKSGATRKDFKLSGHYYMHHINRFTDVRQHWNPVKFRLWRQVYMPYIAYALHGYGVSWKEIRQYLKRLRKESTMMDGMDRACFLKWIGEK